MRRRGRRLAGLLALAAMASALAEAVVASTCAPGMDMAAMDMTPEAMDMAHAAMPTAAHAAANQPTAEAPAHEHAAPERPAGERDCPFGPFAATQGCAGVASMPARVAQLSAPSPEGASSLSFDAAAHKRLFGTALFRPPRA